MKERPILFSPAMVKAILDSRKTQTRRPVMPQPGAVVDAKAFKGGGGFIDSTVGDKDPLVKCPYGRAGDRLWVKERHCYLDVAKKPRNDFKGARDEWDLVVEYSDGTELARVAWDNRPGPYQGPSRPKQTRDRGELKWRPSIFMHRWASRLTLEITAIRVELVQQISEKEVFAEGIQIPVDSETKRPLLQLTGRFPPSAYLCKATIHDPAAFVRAHYASLWDSLNATRGYSWQTNPWVWVVEFKLA